MCAWNDHLSFKWMRSSTRVKRIYCAVRGLRRRRPFINIYAVFSQFMGVMRTPHRIRHPLYFVCPSSRRSTGPETVALTIEFTRPVSVALK